MSSKKTVNIIPVSGTLNRVVIKPEEADKITKGGIIIPDTAKEKPRRGRVVAVSPVDEKGNNPTVKTGDRVLYHKFADDEDIIDGEEYIFAKELDILAILEPISSEKEKEQKEKELA